MKLMTLAASVFFLSPTAGTADQPEVPRPAPLIATGSWATALADHPRLLGPPAHLKALAVRKADLYQQVVKRLQGRYLPADGIIHAVEGLPQQVVESYLRKAMAHVQRGAGNVHQDSWIWMAEAASIYDYLHSAIPPADRRRIIDWLNANRKSFTTDENAFHNSTLSKIRTYLQVAYATWGDNPEAVEFRDYALKKLYEGKVLPVLREFGAGGGFTEAGWYARGSLWHLVEGLEMARRFENYDGYALAPAFFYQRLSYDLHQPYPVLWEYGSERYSVEGDGSHIYGGHTEYPRLMRTVLAQYFRGSELSKFTAAKRRNGSSSEVRVSDFLYEEDPDEKADLSRFSLAHLASGIGKVYARSDWTPDATWFRFECGDYWAGHQHFETGNFEIFRREPLATESGEYESYSSNHSVNWLMRSIAHNVILVQQPDEKWQMMRDGGRIAYANDGGQAKKWEWTVDDLPQWKKRKDDFERGEIIGYQDRPGFLYVAADCTRSYAPTKLRSWVRQIVYVRPHTFVIMDRVASTRPEYQKTWLLHCHNKPEIAGPVTSIKNGRGSLQVQTLLPRQAAIRSVEGYTYGGQTFDPPTTALSATAPRWRIEVLPAAPAEEDVFLHVLSTEDNPRTAELFTKGQETGVRLGNTEVLFSGERGGSIQIGPDRWVLDEVIRRGKFE